MNMINFSINQAQIMMIIAIQAYIFNGSKDQQMMIICQELIQQSIGILLVSLSFHLDDLIGSTLTLYLLPLAGCESAIALAQQVAYYPQRGSQKQK